MCSYSLELFEPKSGLYYFYNKSEPFIWIVDIWDPESGSFFIFHPEIKTNSQKQFQRIETYQKTKKKGFRNFATIVRQSRDCSVGTSDVAVFIARHMYTQKQRCDTRQAREELHTATSVAARLCAHFDAELVLQLVVVTPCH
jgi:hypothetical protein